MYRGEAWNPGHALVQDFVRCDVDPWAGMGKVSRYVIYSGSLSPGQRARRFQHRALSSLLTGCTSTCEVQQRAVSCSSHQWGAGSTSEVHIPDLRKPFVWAGNKQNDGAGNVKDFQSSRSATELQWVRSSGISSCNAVHHPRAQMTVVVRNFADQFSDSASGVQQK